MARFVTREIEIPDYLEDDGEEEFGAIPSNWGEPPKRRTPSTQSGLSGGSGSRMGSVGGGGGGDPPPLPVLPDELLDVLSRAPPDSQRNGIPVTSGTISRSSLSLNRPGAYLNSISPALPSLPPHSPLDLPYPNPSPSPRQRQYSDSEGFSTGRTSATSSPSLSRANSEQLDGYDSGMRQSHLPSNPTPSLDASITGSGSSKRSMFRSLPFGRSRTSNGPSPGSTTPASPQVTRPSLPSHPSSDSQWTQRSSSLADAPLSASTSSAIRLSTVNDSPLINARLPPSTPSLQRRPSRQQLATGGGFAQRISHSAREADRWLFEAQAAGLGFGAGNAMSAAEEVIEGEGKNGDGEGGDEKEDGVVGWAGRGEQYTWDLQRTQANDTDYEEEEEENGEAEGISVNTENETESLVDEVDPLRLPPTVETSSNPRQLSPDTTFHDAPQSPEILKTPTLPNVPLTDSSHSVSPLQPNPISNQVTSEHFASPTQAIFDLSTNSEELPRRKDGKLSLPVYSDAPLESASTEATRKRNRSDGDPLDAEGQAELASRLNGFDLHQALPHSQDSLADFVVAVVGPRNVGKSSVVKKGLKPRSSEPPTVIQEDHVGNRVTTTTTSFTIGGIRRTIEVLDIDMHLLRYNDEGVIWPDGLPQCEGAMLCYDSTDPDALGSLSVLLKAFWTRGSDVPLIVLACKAHAPDQGRNATDPTEAAKVCNIYGAGIVTLDGGLEDPSRKTKESFKYIIRQIMENRGEMTRPASAGSNSPTISRRGSLHQYATTSRSPFNVGTSPSTSSPRNDEPYSPGQGFDSPRRQSRSDGLGLGLSVVQEAPFGGSESSEHLVHSLPPPVSNAPTEEPLSPKSQAPTYTSEAPTYESQEGRTQRIGSAELPSGPTSDLERRPSPTKTAPLDLFFSRDDMIDKFLYAAVTGNDEAYVTLFLITYRRFARPFDVLEKLIERFEFVAKRLKSDPLLSRFAQMKICGVLSVWMQNYPGDFVASATFGILSPFLQSLLPSGATWVAHYALELIPLLPSIAAQSDPETSWALPDKTTEDSPQRSPIDSKPKPSLPYDAENRRPSIAPSYESSGSQNAGPHPTSLSVPMSNEGSNQGTSPLSPRPGSDAGTLDTQDSGDQGPSSTSSLRPRGGPNASILVEISNMVMEMREEEVALQITRLAWEMFGGMTPRDLLRHVLAPRDPANPRVALREPDTNVMRSIAFVNYLANWTATLILVQSKIKQRARIMEKMLLIALALREQENFDSLMGVLAGLNSQPIFRLTETMDIVTTKLDGDPRLQPRRAEHLEADRNRLPKKLRSLNRLMAATKSFSAYRLALANSGMNMIPYLGVHLQDITVVNEIKSDLRDGKVNWSKFSQMGRSAAIVLDCSRIAPTLPVEKIVERAILNVPVLDEDRQYTLSYQHQPRQSDKPVGARSRLKTLAKSTFANTN